MRRNNVVAVWTMLVLPVLLLAASGKLAVAADGATDARVAIERGLSFLAQEALTWKEQKKCASCHHAPMALWSLNEAKKLGYAVDEQAVPVLTAWVFDKDDPAKIFPNQPPQETPSINEAVLLLALGLEAGSVDDEMTRAGLTKSLTTLLETQRPDGSWGLQSLAEPIGATPDVITSCVLLSLTAPNAADMGQPGQDARDKGLAWLSAFEGEQSLQGLAVKLLLWKRLGRSAEESEALMRQIVAQQRPDGGWSQIPELTSDAYATGVTLYALAEAGLSAADATIANARTFLVASQEATGSWPMASRPKERDNQPSKNLAPITFSGTAWAVLGLMHSEPTSGGKPVSFRDTHVRQSSTP